MFALKERAGLGGLLDDDMNAEVIVKKAVERSALLDLLAEFRMEEHCLLTSAACSSNPSSD